MKNKLKLLLFFCGIMLLVITSLYSWKAVAEWNRRRIFEDVMAGNFSAVQGLDAEKMHELEYVYQLAEENGRIAWIECDINEDDKKELIMLESFRNGRESIITGIFIIKGSKCIRILWDINDYSSCYYLVENMVIQYSEEHGLGTQYCYVKYEVDPEGKMTTVKRFEIIDILEEDDITPNFIERGFTEPGSYYVVTAYGKDGYNSGNETRMGREEWMSEFNREIGDYETVNLENYGAEPDSLFLKKHKEISTEMKANAYGIRYDIERQDRLEKQRFY